MRRNMQSFRNNIYLYINKRYGDQNMKVSTKLTSIKIIEDIYKNFKADTVNTKMSLQKLINRSMYLYNSDESFKNRLDYMDRLTISGSGY